VEVWMMKRRIPWEELMTSSTVRRRESNDANRLSLPTQLFKVRGRLILLLVMELRSDHLRYYTNNHSQAPCP